MTPRSTTVMFGLATLVALAGGAPAAAQPIQIVYTATVQTVSGNPFGFDSSVRLSPMTGFFRYDTRTADSSPADPARGNYTHTGAFPGGFTATVQATTITGSTTPFAQVENLNPDTFRFRDGLPNGGTMFVNGAPNAAVTLLLAMTDSPGTAFTNDALPVLFPFSRPPFANPAPTFPHTFSLSDGSGTLLMQFNTLTQIPEPSALLLTLAAPAVVVARRWGRRQCP